jgi:hypothetical protein
MDAYSGSIRVVTPSNVLSNLRAARQGGAKVILRLTAVDVQNANGTFSLTKWKAAVDRFSKVDLSSFVGDGTMAGHLLIQAPENARRWGGQRISHATLDEMARYSRARWAAVPTIVESTAPWLASGTAWRYLDAVSVVYTASAGDAAAWADRQADAAASARLGLVIGMNALNGGTSASGIAGTQSGKYAMSASQLRSWGGAMVAEQRACGFVLQRYQERYFTRTDVKGALAELMRLASAREAPSCRTR